MRRLRFILPILVCLLCAICVSAGEPSYHFSLTVDGQSEKQVQTGDIITVYCVLERTDSTSPEILYAFQNEIEYDRSFFSLVEDSFVLGNAVVAHNVERNPRIQELYVNYLSLLGGVEWQPRTNVCIFQMQVIGENGVGRLHCRDYAVPMPDGSASYPVTAEDLCIVVNESCTVDFDTMGGSTVPSQVVQRFEKATKPADPVRPGYRFTGWSTDENGTEPWHYDAAVTHNLYLYAGWERDPDGYRFTDVQKSDWFYEGISYAVEHGLMNGVSATAFAPNGETSRAMLVTILWRLAGSPAVDLAMTFTDVAQEQWYTEAIRWAAGTGIVQGYSETTFGLNDPVTREQMAVILYRYAKTKGVSLPDVTTDLSHFRDADAISTWAVDGLGWAVYMELLRGVGDDTLAPTGYASRAQTATILMRFCETVLG